VPKPETQTIRMTKTDGVKMSWEVRGDEVHVESNILITEAQFRQMVPDWIIECQSSSNKS
jgi:hypothetical protein